MSNAGKKPDETLTYPRPDKLRNLSKSSKSHQYGKPPYAEPSPGISTKFCKSATGAGVGAGVLVGAGVAIGAGVVVGVGLAVGAGVGAGVTFFTATDGGGNTERHKQPGRMCDVAAEM